MWDSVRSLFQMKRSKRSALLLSLVLLCVAISGNAAVHVSQYHNHDSRDGLFR